MKKRIEERPSSTSAQTCVSFSIARFSRISFWWRDGWGQTVCPSIAHLLRLVLFDLLEICSRRFPTVRQSRFVGWIEAPYQPNQSRNEGDRYHPRLHLSSYILLLNFIEFRIDKSTPWSVPSFVPVAANVVFVELVACCIGLHYRLRIGYCGLDGLPAFLVSIIRAQRRSTMTLLYFTVATHNQQIHSQTVCSLQHSLILRVSHVKDGTSAVRREAVAPSSARSASSSWDVLPP